MNYEVVGQRQNKETAGKMIDADAGAKGDAVRAPVSRSCFFLFLSRPPCLGTSVSLLKYTALRLKA